MSWMPVRNISVMTPFGVKPLPAPVENFVRIPVWPRSGMGTGWMEALRQLASSPGDATKKAESWDSGTRCATACTAWFGGSAAGGVPLAVY